MADDGFDGGPASHRPYDDLGEAALVAGDMDLEHLALRGVVAAIADIGDDLAEADAHGVLDCRDDSGQRVAVMRIAGQRLDMGDELAAAAALQRGGDGDLDAELVGLVGFALANALDLRSVQGIHLLAPLAQALIPDVPGPATVAEQRPASAPAASASVKCGRRANGAGRTPRRRTAGSRILQPAFAQAFVGQVVHRLENGQSRH